MGGVACGVVGHRVNGAAVHHAIGVLAFGADIQAENGVVGLDKFRFDMIIDGEGVLFVQRLRPVDDLGLLHGKMAPFDDFAHILSQTGEKRNAQPCSRCVKRSIADAILIPCGQTFSQLWQATQAAGCFSTGRAASSLRISSSATFRL